MPRCGSSYVLLLSASSEGSWYWSTRSARRRSCGAVVVLATLQDTEITCPSYFLIDSVIRKTGGRWTESCS